MTSGVTTKVRLVQCPKCRQVLPELADFPLYQCGGCGTILQAKNRKSDPKSIDSGLHETDAAQTNAVDLVVEDKESNSSNKEILTSLGECSLDQNNERDQKQLGDCISEQLGGINVSNEDQNDERNQSQSEDCYGEQLGGVNLSPNYQSSDIDKIESCDCNVEQLGVSKEVCLSTELASQRNEEPSPIAQENSEVEANDEGLLSAGAKSEIDIKEGDSNFRSLNTDNLVATNGIISIATHHMPARESTSSDTFETAEFVNPSSELSGGLRDLSKSPTRNYYAYEGSVSSYDGTDDHLPEQYIPSYGSAYKVSDFVPSAERHKKDKFQVNGMMSCSSYIEHEGEIHSSAKKHLANKSKWDQDELLEPTIHDRPVKNWRRRERESHPSRVPFYQRASLSGYESGGPSNEEHNQFDRNTSFCSSGKSEYLEPDKMKLLRMVSELQDELSKRCYPSGMPNGRVSTWKEKHIPSYYDHEAAEEVCHDLSYPRFPRRSMQGSSQLQQSNSSHIPFSGETTRSRHQAHHSCQHCYPQDWQCSVQLPVPILHHNKGSCWVHPGHNLYNSYSSCPSSPQWYVDSKFPMCSRETKSAEQRHKGHEVKKYLREKQHLVKRHFRPIAGGAPIITCYSCLSPLQLPADFVLSRRRFHRLRCGACSELLKFSLQNSTHIVPYSLNAVDPPPSEVDDYSDSINRRLVSASHSHANACLQADPVSCSDDYGLSYCKSGSTEADPVSITSFHALQGNINERNLSYESDPFKPMGERKKFVLNQSQKKQKNFGHDTSRPSSNLSKEEKLSSEIEELPATSSTPLHQLMGYSLPSQVINGSGPSGTRGSSYSTKSKACGQGNEGS
ncbi:hypothetical protein ACB092_06G171900 [Castanea dentata]